MGDLRVKTFGNKISSIENAIVTLTATPLIYDGFEKVQGIESVVLNGTELVFGKDYVIIGDTAINAGEHQLTILGVLNYSGAITKMWRINKAQGSISVSPTTLEIKGTVGTTQTATITKKGDGAVSVASSAPGVATASISGDTVTVECVAEGSATITIALAESNNYIGATCTIEVSINFKPSASTNPSSGVSYTSGLSGLSASDVSLLAETISNSNSITNTTSVVYVDCGSMHRKLSLGDQVTLSLNSTNYEFDIIGFNHDDLTTATAYGTSTATGKAGITFQMHNLFITSKQMHYDTDITRIGWKDCYMRTNYMDTIKGYLPSEWQSVIKPVDKKTIAGYSSSILRITSDECFILSAIEIDGSSSSEVQYAYYQAGNSATKSIQGQNYKTTWWTRSSPRYNVDENRFQIVDSKGVINGTYLATSSFNFSLAFCV